MNKTKWLLYLSLAMFLLSCATNDLRVVEYQVSSSDVPNPAKPSDEFYIIGSGDVLGIYIWKEPSLSGTVKVRPDGFITLPLINEVRATGLVTAELRRILDEKYGEFINEPYVTIRVEQVVSSEVFLIGQVNKPGAYPLFRNDTVLQLLTRAGGLNVFARRGSMRVIRRVDRKVTEFIIDYDAIIAGDFKQDILLKPGDRIIIP